MPLYECASKSYLTRPLRSRRERRKRNDDAPRQGHMHDAEFASPGCFDRSSVEALRQGIAR